MLPTSLKSALRGALPRGAVHQLANLREQLRPTIPAARAAFETAPGHPAWLEPDELPHLNRLHPAPPATAAAGVDYYSAEKVLRRGQERVPRLRRLLAPRADHAAPRSLELGAGDAMVSALLSKKETAATAIDVDAEGFDPRAPASGVRCELMDAAQLDLPSDHFDLVFSFDALEHIPRPDLALAEAIRVTRPGGVIYLHFGPLYRSADGLHAYEVIGIPYLQFLFERKVVDEFTEREGLQRIDYEQCNGWPLARFQELFEASDHALERLVYRERWDARHADMIARYPHCFRNETDRFDDLMIAYIEVAFRKRR